MKKLAIVFIGLAGMLSAATFTGVITDSMCLKDHKSMGIAPEDKCVRECAKSGGVLYVLFDGKKAYKLSDQKMPAAFAARRVRVTGTLYEKTGIIKVDHIEAQR